METDQTAEAQLVLDELFREHSIPFKLSVGKTDPVSQNQYIIRFHDSRLHSVDFTLKQGESFKDEFRAAVVERVKKLSGPLHSP